MAHPHPPTPHAVPVALLCICLEQRACRCSFVLCAISFKAQERMRRRAMPAAGPSKQAQACTHPRCARRRPRWRSRPSAPPGTAAARCWRCRTMRVCRRAPAGSASPHSRARRGMRSRWRWSIAARQRYGSTARSPQYQVDAVGDAAGVRVEHLCLCGLRAPCCGGR